MAGHDGQQAARLLQRAQDEGAAVLGDITESVVERALQGSRQRKRMAFTKEEKQQLADALAATIATADLLGRARIRKRQQMASKYADGEVGAFTRKAQRFAEGVESFSDSPTDFSCFDDNPIRPLQPLKALEWFRSLFPEIGVKQADWLKDIQKRAFSLAVTTEESLLARVHKVIADVLETGAAAQAPQTVQRILDEAGVSPRNPQYCDMIVRTNLMNSLNSGAQEELKQVAEDFPVWRWLGIRDGRQRHTHEVHFDCYFPSSVTFAEVRDSEKGEYDGFNDRCTMQPIWKGDWKRLQASGARIKDGWER